MAKEPALFFVCAFAINGHSLENSPEAYLQTTRAGSNIVGSLDAADKFPSGAEAADAGRASLTAQLGAEVHAVQVRKSWVRA